MAEFTMRQGDLEPALRANLVAAGGSIKNLSDAQEVRFKMGTSTGVLKVNKVIIPADAPNGLCVYEWQEGDTDTAGTFFAEFEVINANGKTETFPNFKPFSISIKADKL